jgi:hypothetical protein
MSRIQLPSRSDRQFIGEIHAEVAPDIEGRERLFGSPILVILAGENIADASQFGSRLCRAGIHCLAEGKVALDG